MSENENPVLIAIAGHVINAYQSALILRQLKGLSEPDEKTRESMLEDMIRLFSYTVKKIETGPK